MMRLPLLLAGLIAVSPVHADDVLSRTDVEAFLSPLPERARAAVQAKDWLGIIRWLENHLADEAPVSINGEVVTAGGAVVHYTVAMTGAEYKYLTSITTVMPQMMDVAQNIRSYDISLDIEAVSELADGTASASVVITETGQFDLPGTYVGIGREGILPEDKIFESIHSCRLRLVPDEPDPRVAMMACRVETYL